MKNPLSLFARLETLMLCFQEENPEDALLTKDPELFMEFMEFFKIPAGEAVLLCAAIHLNLQEETLSFKRLSELFKIPVIRVMNRKKQLDELKLRKYIHRVNQRRHRWTEDGNQNAYYLNDKVIRALMDDQAFEEYKHQTQTDWFDVLFEIYYLAKKRDEDEIDTEGLLAITEDLITQHRDMPLFQYVDKLKLSMTDTYILLYCIASHLSGDESIDMNGMADKIFDYKSKRVRTLQSLTGRQNELIRTDLLLFTVSEFTDYINLVLSEKLLAELENISITTKVNSTRLSAGLLHEAEKIHAKDLFYNAEEEKQLHDLSKLLMPEKFDDLCTRMESKKLAPALVVLLYGEPGTGKTESVYQFAKQSGRSIVKVDISKSKSSFFGESEKMIKQIFTRYQQALEQCALAPILLFNEADALIGQRRNNQGHNLMQTENAMQNILLEELENFRGILMATTNRAEHMDPAYDRRFLYKIKFHAPGPDIRCLIWKNKLPFLSEKECVELAYAYTLSGGQIDNVLKKVELNFVLHQQEADIMSIQHFCEQELLLRKHEKRIGFKP